MTASEVLDTIDIALAAGCDGERCRCGGCPAYLTRSPEPLPAARVVRRRWWRLR